MDQSKSLWRSLDTVTASGSEALDIADLRVPGLTILAHGDPQRIGECTGLPALASGREVELSRLSPAFCAPGERGIWRPLAEPHLSRHPLQLTPSPAGAIHLRTAGSRTRVEVDGVVVADQRIISATELEDGVVLLLADRVTLLLHYLDPSPPSDVPRFDLVGESPAMVSVRQQIARVADLEVPVLVRGETGTGKEVVANSIHDASGRRTQPLIAVNMGALPPSLAAAELFGTTKGAFTGADRHRAGFFGRAKHGTLFLDEIGEAPFEVQGMLLRTLETGEVQPVGSESTRQADARIIAATDAVLETAIEDGRFRAPLLHRLSGYEVWLPPLRKRRDDIGRLLVHFLRQELVALNETWRLESSGGKHPWLPAPLVARLVAYDWPGNVRQLRNIARQLIIAHRGARRLSMTSRIERLLNEDREMPSPVPSPPMGAPSMHQDTPSASESMIYDRPVLRTLVSLGWPNPGGEAPESAQEDDLQGQLDRLARRLLSEFDGYEVERSKGFLLLFSRPVDAVGYAFECHVALSELSTQVGFPLQACFGIHLGEVIIRRNTTADIARGAKPFEVEGAARTIVQQVMRLARDGQSLITRAALDLAKQGISASHPAANGPLVSHSHGAFNLVAASEGVEILEVGLGDSTALAQPVPNDALGEGTAPQHGNHLYPSRIQPTTGSPPPKAPAVAYRPPDEVSEDELLEALRAHTFRLQPTAAALRISRTSLYALIERSPRIRKAKDLEREDIEHCQQRCANDLDLMAKELEVSRKGLRRRMTQLGMP